MKLTATFRRMKLASQFTLLLSLLFVVALLTGSLALSKALEQRSEVEISDRAQLVLNLMDSVSSYTHERVRPLFDTEAQTQLIPESIPSFASHQVFDRFRTQWQYRDFTYKTAALNPTNLDDQADLFEAKLIERFESDRAVKTLSGFRNATNSQQFYSAQPLTITQESCLRCHSTPEQAPKSHLDRYGKVNGYGWKLNQIIGTRIVYLPAQEVFSNARQALFGMVVIFSSLFAVVLWVIQSLLKRRVIQPLKPMAQLAEQLSADSVNAAEVDRNGLSRVIQRSDEIGQLGRVFDRMVQDICDREQQRSEQIRQLRVEIDQTKRQQQVAEIESADYFQKLQQTAQQIREQWSSN